MWTCKTCQEQHDDSFGVCWNCGTTIDGVADATMNRQLTLEIDAAPGAILFSGTCRGALVAHVCGKCGFAELFATNPNELLATYRRSLEN